VPAVFAAEHRRAPIVLIAAWLVVLQAFLAGVVTARAGAMFLSDPIDAAICHGRGGLASMLRLLHVGGSACRLIRCGGGHRAGIAPGGTARCVRRFHPGYRPRRDPCRILASPSNSRMKVS
jgi:hypothetical protein